MKIIGAALLVMLAILQYRLWLGEGNVAEIYRLNLALETQNAENATLRERNAALDADVQDLKRGYDAIEERARSELGMIRQDETFYRVVERQ